MQETIPLILPPATDKAPKERWVDFLLSFTPSKGNANEELEAHRGAGELARCSYCLSDSEPGQEE